MTLAPIAGASILLDGVENFTTSTDASGLFVFTGRDPGPYFIWARKPDYATEVFDNIDCHRSCNISPIAIGPGTFVADFALDPLGIVSGTITADATGAPVDQAGVRLLDSTGQQFAGITTDATGVYEFHFVDPGTYTLRVEPPAPYLWELYRDIPCAPLACPSRGGTPVVVVRGVRATVDVAVAVGGAISGTVRQAIDGAPVAGLGVTVYTTNGERVRGAITDGAGGYTIDRLPPGAYVVATNQAPASAQPTVIPAVFGGGECPVTWTSVRCRVTFGTPVIVTTGATTTGIDFSLRSTATISGTVVDSSGTPVPNIDVSADADGVTSAGAVTDVAGRYTISGLDPGSYRVRTFAPSTLNLVDEWFGGACIGCAGTPSPVTVASGDARTGVDFELAAGGSIAGRFTCSPVVFGSAFVGIVAYSARGEAVKSASGGCSVASSDFTISGLPTGTYYVLSRDGAFVLGFPPRLSSGDVVDELYSDNVCVTADCDVRRGTPVAVTAGQVTTGINIDVKRGATIANIQGQIYDARGVPLVSVLRRTTIRAAGFDAVGLPPGTYYVKDGPILYNGIVCPDCPPTMGTPIVIGPDLQGVTLANPPVGDRRITGTVRDSAGGAALGTVTVEVYTAAGQLAGSDVSDLAGGFVVQGLVPGTYVARTVNERGYVDRIYDAVVCDGCGPTAGTPIVVSTADVSGIDFLLTSGAPLSGIVAGGGLPVNGAGVSVFDGTGALAARATADAAGQYRVDVPPGTYYARTDPMSGWRTELFDDITCARGTCDVLNGTPVTVAPGVGAGGVSFDLAACSGLSLSPPHLASGAVGDPYRQRFTLAGAASAGGFTLVQGSLPPGLTLDSVSGVLTGTPTSLGRYDIAIAGSDETGCASVNTYSLDVAQCSFVLDPASATVDRAGGSVPVSILDGCGDRTVTSGVPWVQPDTAASTASRIVLTVDANPLATPRSGTVTIGRRVFTLRQGAAGSQPAFGTVDIPADGAVVSGSMAMGGWALDDLEVARVRIYRDPVAGEGAGRVLLGTAVFIRGARPDVERAFAGSPLNDRAGWGFLILTNMLPNQGNGVFRLHAFAEDVEGHETLLGSRTIIAANLSATLPFGAIDTPGQGETIGGVEYVNFGWALTPRPKTIPFDGSTIRVFIDGAPVGTVNYNFFRSDVSTLFPGLANSAGPVGFRVIDTTALAEGIHTISWAVVDDAGEGAGIGSRYFTVSNSADAQPGALRAFARVQIAAVPLEQVTGPEMGRRTASVTGVAAAGPTRTISIAPTDRVDLALDPEATSDCAATWAGYLDAAGELRALPTGASIDATGRFYWEPGAAFNGQFDLVFVKTACGGERSLLSVRVTIERP